MLHVEQANCKGSNPAILHFSMYIVVVMKVESRVSKAEAESIVGALDAAVVSADDVRQYPKSRIRNQAAAVLRSCIL